MNQTRINGKIWSLFKVLSWRMKILWVVLIVLSPLLMIWLAIWGFANQSLDGLFAWSLTFRTLIVLALIFCIGMPGFCLGFIYRTSAGYYKTLSIQNNVDYAIDSVFFQFLCTA